MQDIIDFFKILLDSEALIKYGGLALLLIIIFAETGIFFGFIFPGDALLFTAGILCGTKEFPINIFVLIFTVMLAAIIGNLIGFLTGQAMRKTLFTRKDSFFFKQKHLEKASLFYEKYGGISLIAGRFIPVVRTFVPVFAGAIEMNFWRFNYYNVVGGVLWIGTLIPLGYLLGRKVPSMGQNLEWVFLIISIIASTILIRGLFKLKGKKRDQPK